MRNDRYSHNADISEYDAIGNHTDYFWTSRFVNILKEKGIIQVSCCHFCLYALKTTFFYLDKDLKQTKLLCGSSYKLWRMYKFSPLGLLFNPLFQICPCWGVRMVNIRQKAIPAILGYSRAGVLIMLVRERTVQFSVSEVREEGQGK